MNSEQPPGGPGDRPPVPPPDAVLETRRLVRAAMLALPLLAVALVVGLGMGVPDGLFTAFLLGSMPLLSLAQLPLLRGALVKRMEAYRGSVVMLMVLTTVALVLGALGPGLESLGLVPRFGVQDWIMTGVLAVGLTVFGVVSNAVTAWLEIPETDVLRELIPRTGAERATFGLVSLSAGLGEEVVYRGYLIVVLGALFSDVWWAAAVSSMAFSILHAYQGVMGIVRSGVLGFVFAAAFITGGSLWPLIIVHTGVDLVSGLWLGPRMLSREGAES